MDEEDIDDLFNPLWNCDLISIKFISIYELYIIWKEKS